MESIADISDLRADGRIRPIALVGTSEQIRVVLISDSSSDGHGKLVMYDPSSCKVVASYEFDEDPVEYLCAAQLLLVTDSDSDGVNDLLCASIATEAHRKGPKMVLRLLSGRSLELVRRIDLFDALAGGELSFKLAPFSLLQDRICNSVVVLGPLMTGPIALEMRAQVVMTAPLALGETHSLGRLMADAQVMAPLFDEVGNAGLAVSLVDRDSHVLARLSARDFGVAWTKPIVRKQEPPYYVRAAESDDIDRRGTTDVVVGWIGVLHEDALHCVAGEDGDIIWRSEGKWPYTATVNSIVDVTSDGNRDLLVAIGGASVSSPGRAISLLDGSTGKAVAAFVPDGAAGDFGSSLVVGPAHAGSQLVCCLDNGGTRLWILRVQ